MHLTVTTAGDEIYNLDVSDDFELENLAALLEFESGVAASEIVLYFNGSPLTDRKKTLLNYGIKDGDILLMNRARQRPVQAPAPAQITGMDWSSISVPGQSNSAARGPPPPAQQPDQDNPATIRDMFLADPHQLALLKERNQPLADALLSGSLEKFTEVLSQQRQRRADLEMRRIRQLMADPLDINAQQEIAEEIRMSNVNANMETAMEYTPESFGQVVMLYINCMVNGHPVKAFVDSGAQMTIMSKACAEKCNIMRLVDHRWAGIAKGVGVQKIIGRVHMAQIQIEDVFLPTSFSVLEHQPMDMLLGLDMLKRHQCCIDLKRNVLQIGTTSTETRFLPESELPECATRGGREESPGELSGSIQEIEDQELAKALAESSKGVAGASGTQGGASTSASSGPVSGSNSNEFPEDVVQRLVQMGFSPDEVVKQLRQSGGDANLAATILLAKSIKPPTK